MRDEQYQRRLRVAAIGLAALNLPAVFALDMRFHVFALDMREWLVYFDPWFVLCVVIPGFVILLPALPFLVKIDRSESAATSNRFWLAGTALILFCMETLWWLNILIATFCRGPNWNFYWPWQARVPRVELLTSVNVSTYWWIFWLERRLPSNPFLREAPGVILLVVHFFVFTSIAWCFLRYLSPQMPHWRVLLFLLIVQVLNFIPLKMLFHHFLHGKYIVSFPEVWLNI